MVGMGALESESVWAEEAGEAWLALEVWAERAEEAEAMPSSVEAVRETRARAARLSFSTSSDQERLGPNSGVARSASIAATSEAPRSGWLLGEGAGAAMGWDVEGRLASAAARRATSGTRRGDGGRPFFRLFNQ